MAGGGPSKAGSRAEQQALARERIRSERKARKSRSSKDTQGTLGIGIKPIVVKIRTQRFVIKKGAPRASAYDAIKHSGALLIYFKKFQYHDNIQKACMAGEFTIEAPESVVLQITRELAGAWSMGAAAAVTEVTL